MKCPHCGDSFTPQWSEQELGGDPDTRGSWILHWTKCPSCDRLVARMIDFWFEGHQSRVSQGHLVHPAIPTPVIPDEVQEPFAQEMREASAILGISPKASAALSRRLLQHLLREKGGVKPANLVSEIEEMRGKNVLPATLSDDLDSVRNVGNFAAHPIKNTETEAVADVEEGEAEWLLELLGDLLDAFFVAPAKREARREALNKKLAAAGKKPLAGTGQPESEVANE